MIMCEAVIITMEILTCNVKGKKTTEEEIEIKYRYQSLFISLCLFIQIIF
jgi:hypothetical protein